MVGEKERERERERDKEGQSREEVSRLQMLLTYSFSSTCEVDPPRLIPSLAI